MFCLLLSLIMWPHYHPSWAYSSFGHDLTLVSMTDLTIKKQLFPSFPPFCSKWTNMSLWITRVQLKDSLPHRHRGRNANSSHLCGRSFCFDSVLHFALGNHPYQRMTVFLKNPNTPFHLGYVQCQEYSFIDTGWPFKAIWLKYNMSSIFFSLNGLKTFLSTCPGLLRRYLILNISKMDK